MKKLYRSKNDRIVAGVCGGLGDYFELDSNLIRILMALFILITGIGILAYLVIWLIVPEDEGEKITGKRFYRSLTDKKVAGIFGGLGEYLDMDSNILRVIFLFLFFLTAVIPLGLVYLITWLLIPSRSEAQQSPEVEIIQ